VITGSLLLISGQIAREGDEFICGQVRDEQDLVRAQYAARSCGIALLSQARDAVEGNLDRIARVIRIGGFVNAAPQFTQHASFMNGCSKLMLEVFGDSGRHVRTAVGCSSLPRGVMVEAEAVFELRS
jgi:enamine deaminase RidA (YjgF/YER057c/UK114 family)